MAEPDYVFMDGFDKYGASGGSLGFTSDVNSNVILGEWTTSSNSIGIVSPLGVSSGYAVQFSATGNFSKVLPANYARCIGGMWYRCLSSSTQSQLLNLNDGGTTQCSIYAGGNLGFVGVYRGAGTTFLGSSPANSVLINTTHCIEWDITVHNTLGVVKLWLNGNLVVNLTNVDTASNTNNYYNRLDVPGNSGQMDHFYSWHYLVSGGSETPCLTNPVILTDVAVADVDTDFAVGASTVGNGEAVGSSNFGGSTAYFRKITCEVDCSITGAGVIPATTNAGPKLKFAIYSDNSGSPGTALGTTTETAAGITSGVPKVGTFPSPVALTAGTSYWLAFMPDSGSGSHNYWWLGSNNTSLGGTRSATYASFPPAGGALTSGAIFSLWAVVDPATLSTNDNWSVVNEIPWFGQNYVYSASVGDEDFFDFPNLTYTPTAIYTVALKGVLLKSDNAVKTAAIQLQSGATTSAGSNPSVAPSLSSTWYSTYFPSNPDGNVAWTKTAFDAMRPGYKVLS